MLAMLMTAKNRNRGIEGTTKPRISRKKLKAFLKIVYVTPGLSDSPSLPGKSAY
jgi:hypothetical protein